MNGRADTDDVRSLVLGLLARREMYGYELAVQIRGTAEAAAFAEGSVYPALRRLERDGLARSHWVEIGPDVPRRRYYVLTPRGEAIAERAALRARSARLRSRTVRP